MKISTKAVAYIVAALCLLVPQSIVNAESITLESLREHVVANHPVFRSEDYRVEENHHDRDSNLGDQDWRIGAGANYFYHEPVSAISPYPERVNGVEVYAGASRKIWASGSMVSLELRNRYFDQSIEGFVIDTPEGTRVVETGLSRFYRNGINFSFVQPLLKNLGGSLDTLAYDLAEMEAKIAEIESKERKESFLLEISAKFLNWRQLEEQLEIFRSRLELAKAQVRRNKRKEQENLIDAVDTLRARDNQEVITQQLHELEGRRNAVRQSLATLVNNQALTRMNPKFSWHIGTSPKALTEAEQRVNENSRVLAAIALRTKQAQRLKDAEQEKGAQELNVVASLGLVDGSDRFSSSTDYDHLNSTIGLEYRYPLGATTAKELVAKLDSRINRLDQETEYLKRQLTAQLRSHSALLASLRQSLTVNKQQIAIAKRKSEEEYKLYQQGRGNFSFVLQSQDDVQNAKLRLASNSARYHILLLEYREILDVLYEPQEENS